VADAILSTTVVISGLVSPSEKDSEEFSI